VWLLVAGWPWLVGGGKKGGKSLQAPRERDEKEREYMRAGGRSKARRGWSGGTDTVVIDQGTLEKVKEVTRTSLLSVFEQQQQAKNYNN